MYRRRICLISVPILLLFAPCYSYRILAIFPFNGTSHFNVLGEIAKALAEKGHQVDVISPFPLKEKIPNYTDLITIRKLYHAESLSFDIVKSQDLIFKLGHKFSLDMCKILEQPDMSNLINNPPTDPPYDLVLTHVLPAYACFSAIGHLWNVSVVSVTTSFMLPFDYHSIGNPLNLAISSRNQWVYKENMTFWDRLYNFVKTHHLIWTNRGLEKSENLIIKKYFGDRFPHYTVLHKSVSLILSNSHYSLHGIKPKVPALVEIGGIHITDDNSTIDSVRKIIKIPIKCEISNDQQTLTATRKGGSKLNRYNWSLELFCLPRLIINESSQPFCKRLQSMVSLVLQSVMDKSTEGFVYVSFGSRLLAETFPNEIVLKLFAVYENLAPIQIIMRSTDPDLLTVTIPKNVHFFSWLPQKNILQHRNIKAFVTHGGGLSLQETVYYGVPIVCVPVFYDQFTNCGIAANKKIGLELDIKTAEQQDYFDVFNKILNDSSYAKASKKLSSIYRDRLVSPRQEAVYWIEYVIRHGKNVLRSPTVDLEWWKIELLDVLAFIALCILLATSTVIFALRRLFRLILSRSASQSILQTELSKKLN